MLAWLRSTLIELKKCTPYIRNAIQLKEITIPLERAKKKKKKEKEKHSRIDSFNKTNIRATGSRIDRHFGTLTNVRRNLFSQNKWFPQRTLAKQVNGAANCSERENMVCRMTLRVKMHQKRSVSRSINSHMYWIGRQRAQIHTGHSLSTRRWYNLLARLWSHEKFHQATSGVSRFCQAKGKDHPLFCGHVINNKS